MSLYKNKCAHKRKKCNLSLDKPLVICYITHTGREHFSLRIAGARADEPTASSHSLPVLNTNMKLSIILAALAALLFCLLSSRRSVQVAPVVVDNKPEAGKLSDLPPVTPEPATPPENPYLVDWGYTSAEVNKTRFKPIQLKESSKPNTVTIPWEDKYLHFITNETNTFTDLMDQVKRTAPPEQIIYVDRHFNAGGGSGFLMLSNEKGVSFAMKLNDEYEKIYLKYSWQFYAEPKQIRREGGFAVLNLATQRNIAAVIDEFGFIDDPLNGEAIRAFMRSRNGQLEIAAATLTAIVNADFRHIVMGAGHNGQRGTSGANMGGYSEVKYAFETFEAMNQLIQDGFVPKKELEPTEVFQIQVEPEPESSGEPSPTTPKKPRQSTAKPCRT